MAKHRFGTKKKTAKRGGKSRKRSHAKKRAHAKRSRGGGKKDARGLTIHYCSRGACARRPIFGGTKGFATHNRRKHRG